MLTLWEEMEERPHQPLGVTQRQGAALIRHFCTECSNIARTVVALAQ